ncbi:MAG: lysylphosphatidylglycerol synthase transmembrane domain-containing protein [Nitrospirota bacterium]
MILKIFKYSPDRKSGFWHGRRRSILKHILSIIVSLSIIVFVYSKIDVSNLLHLLLKPDMPSMASFFLMFLPIIFVKTFRWHIIALSNYKAGFYENFKYSMASNFWNLIIPSKLGDTVKVYYLVKDNMTGIINAVDLVMAEKICDILSLCVLTIFFASVYNKHFEFIAILNVVAFLPLVLYLALVIFNLYGNASNKTASYIKKIPLGISVFQKMRDNKKLPMIIGLSLLLWFFHLTQFLFIFRAMNSHMDAGTIYLLLPIVIFAGLIPITIAGVGTREAALLTIFNGMESPAVLIAVGALAILRYLIPPLLGLPFVFMLNSERNRTQMSALK